jgi:hypothetical protein
MELDRDWEGAVTDHDHYIWRVRHAGVSRLLVEVRAGGLAVFVSNSVKYPDEHLHSYSKGYFQDCQDNKILDPYPPEFKLAYFPKLSVPYYKAPDDLATRTEVTLCIDTDDWVNSSACFITVQNLTPLVTPYRITVIELQEEDAVDESRAGSYRVFKGLYDAVDGASESYHERRRLKILEDLQFTYGEVEFVHIAKVLDITLPKAGEVFVDLGCGTGKCVVAAALAYPQLAEVRGIELMRPLYEQCQGILRSLPQDAAVTTVVLGDILELDWADADIVYSSSVCYSESLLDYITQASDLLKAGSRVVSLKALHLSSKFTQEAEVSVKMSWGYNDAFVYLKHS